MALNLSSLPNPLRENLSFYTIPLAWFIALSPRFYGARMYSEATDGGDLDIRNPRAFSDEVAQDPQLEKSTRNRIMRAEAAMDNGFEFIGSSLLRYAPATRRGWRLAG